MIVELRDHRLQLVAFDAHTNKCFKMHGTLTPCTCRACSTMMPLGEKQNEMGQAVVQVNIAGAPGQVTVRFVEISGNRGAMGYGPWKVVAHHSSRAHTTISFACESVVEALKLSF